MVSFCKSRQGGHWRDLLAGELLGFGLSVLGGRMSLLSLFPLRVALLSVAFLLVPSSQCLADFFNPEEKRDSVELTTGQKQAEAQFKLGVKYLEGDGVQQSYEEAVKWFRKAA